MKFYVHGLFKKIQLNDLFFIKFNIRHKSFYFFEFSFWIDDVSSREKDGNGYVGDLGGGIGGKGGIGSIGRIGNIGNCIPIGGGGRTEASKGTKLKAKFINENQTKLKIVKI